METETAISVITPGGSLWRGILHAATRPEYGDIPARPPARVRERVDQARSGTSSEPVWENM
ncbi:hypothetical protein GCM10009772_15890 [Pseudonocardia alni subsp. carboxydivorans]